MTIKENVLFTKKKKKSGWWRAVTELPSQIRDRSDLRQRTRPVGAERRPRPQSPESRDPTQLAT